MKTLSVDTTNTDSDPITVEEVDDAGLTISEEDNYGVATSVGLLEGSDPWPLLTKTNPDKTADPSTSSEDLSPGQEHANENITSPISPTLPSRETLPESILQPDEGPDLLVEHYVDLGDLFPFIDELQALPGQVARQRDTPPDQPPAMKKNQFKLSKTQSQPNQAEAISKEVTNGQAQLQSSPLPSSLPPHPLFEVTQMGIDRRLLVNRKRQLKMYRVWLQGTFTKRE